MATALIPFSLDTPIPPAIEVGRGAVLVVRGWVAPPRGQLPERFAVALDDELQSFEHAGDARFDLPMCDGRRPLGFFLPVSIDASHAGRTSRLRLLYGKHVLVEQSIAFAVSAPPTIAIDTPIAICLGTYNPDEALLARQLASLRAQTRRDWTCLIHDDGSTPERFAMLGRQVEGDARFRLVRSEHNRGFYRNFEAGLALVPPTTPYVALCDQDDAWYPDKLASVIDALEAAPAAQLAYCDMRIVNRDGRVRSHTYWRTRRNNYRRLDTLLFVNSVTGAASVMRGALLDALLPFPPEQGPTFHDHWLACTAFVAGGLVYVDRPLYDYTQHGDNVIGFSDFRPLTMVGTLTQHALDAAEMLVKPGQARRNVDAMLEFYRVDYRRLVLLCRTLLLRFGELDDEVRAALELFDDRPRRAFELIVRRHAKVVARGDSTGMIEFKMGMGKLLNDALRYLQTDAIRGAAARWGRQARD